MSVQRGGVDNMKKVILFFIIIYICLLLCACNDKEDRVNATKSSRNTKKTIEVTESPHNDLQFAPKGDKEFGEYDDLSSYRFWSA